MRKFAAPYLFTNTGLLLKKGMAVADHMANIQFIDTKGELSEMEQMIFYSGMLISPYEFIKKDAVTNAPGENENLLQLFHSALDKEQLSLKEVIDLAKQLQDQFSELTIPEILNTTEQALISKAFEKRTISGLYLITGLDLPNLRFTPNSRLKKIL